MDNKAMRRIIFVFIAFSWNFYTVESYICEREGGWFGQTERFKCPQPGQPESFTFCCGSDENKHCCKGLSDEQIDQIIEKLPAILGTIAAVTLAVIVLCIVCCCCCPFCLMYKRRNRGAVHQPTADAAMQPLQQQQAYPGQPGGYPSQQAAPYQTQAPYPTQAQPYPQQQPYPAQPYPTQQPYPPQQPYPAEQPPPYAEKQPAFNPGYAQ